MPPVKNNCLNCIYHRLLPNNVECQCRHPCVSYGQGAAMRDVLYYGCHEREGFYVEFQPSGVEAGRVAFPTSYDHRYLRRCSGHTPYAEGRGSLLRRLAEFIRFNF